MNKDSFFKNKNETSIESKKLEKEVENLRNYLQELTFFLPLAFCKVNSLDYIVVCSQVFQTVTGYQEVELTNKPVYFLFKDKGRVENFVIRAISKRSTVETEGVIITKQGKEIPVNISVLATTNEKNEFDGYFLTITDITETKRFEQELERRIKERTKELEKAKEKFQESERILEIKVNARTRQLRENAQTLEEKVKERTKILEERTKELERKADTEEKSRTALLNLAEDLEQASSKAQEEKEKTLAIVESFADALFFFNNNKKAEMINPEVEKTFNIKSSEVIGKSFFDLREENSSLKAVFDSIIEEGKEVFRKEVRLDKDVFVEVTSIPIFQKDEVIGTLVDVHDITREKNIEKVKTEFVSLAAHQLRTPLAGIKWTLETVLEEKDEANLPEEIVDFIKKATEANNRMVSLVNDLLNVTRIEEGRYVYDPKNVDMKKVIEASLKEHKEEIEKKGIKFSLTQPKEDVSFVKADEEKLTVVVQNFLDNALKYTKKGEISLKLEELKEEKKIKVSVSDTGVGIPEDEKIKMFNKFVRGENVQRMDTEGSGLGLFISKNIIEAHKGEIGFDSKEGEGSTFFFTLPVVE
ncbi:MAG: PAS domain S-box protein [Candidatus Pacebacteria bacterium]|nr:PAS domain S-box protein [Candidatus Paceibacterota bacterium]